MFFYVNSTAPILNNCKHWGWGFSSVVENLPSKCKALGSVPSSEKKKKKQKNKKKPIANIEALII